MWQCRRISPVLRRPARAAEVILERRPVEILGGLRAINRACHIQPVSLGGRHIGIPVDEGRAAIIVDDQSPTGVSLQIPADPAPLVVTPSRVFIDEKHAGAVLGASHFVHRDPAGDGDAGNAGKRLCGRWVYETRDACRIDSGNARATADFGVGPKRHGGRVHSVVAVRGGVAGGRVALAEVIDGNEVGPCVGGIYEGQKGGVLRAPVGSDDGRGGELRDVHPDGRFASGIPGVDFVGEQRAVSKREAQIRTVRGAVGGVEPRLARGRETHENREVRERRRDPPDTRRDQHRVVEARRVEFAVDDKANDLRLAVVVSDTGDGRVGRADRGVVRVGDGVVRILDKLDAIDAVRDGHGRLDAGGERRRRRDELDRNRQDGEQRQPEAKTVGKGLHLIGAERACIDTDVVNRSTA